ncbi:ATP-dependent DNA helicase RecG [Idiomarina seosinensis]|uniref:ATP-dependent DNA helicase RecG n=1 Tax=Idiomarina seosinensis TaxID=281739 RepID=UPI00384DB0F8
MAVAVSSPLNKIPLTTLKGVGDKVAQKLLKLGLQSVQDAIFHLPLRYEDRTRVSTVAQVRPGSSANLVLEVQHSEIKYGRKRMLLVRAKDNSGSITLRFFQFSAAQLKQFAAGTRVLAFGEVRYGVAGAELIHPEYTVLGPEQRVTLESHLTPVYPTTEGVSPLVLRKIITQALTYLSEQSVTELLPQSLQPHSLSLVDALLVLHHPPPDVSLAQLELGQHPAQQRLASEELIAHQLSLLQLRSKRQAEAGIAVNTSGVLQQRFLQQLPFKPTAAQQRVAEEIASDLQKSIPMMRLVQGDVGSGKTLVAALAALHAIEAGYQVALMAPTELLSEQHALSFRQWLEPLGIQVGWLSGRSKGKARGELLQELADGRIQLLVGTHALFQADVNYHQLALVIIDEQHRFGVHQRLQLREKGEQAGRQPHQLIMTATPIPRTLAMTAYADLATSTIDELPPGRIPVQTVAIADSRRQQVIERVREVCLTEGRQAYWVCTLIEESEALECQAAEDTANELQQALGELSVGLVHGRLKPAQKEAVMQAFKAGQLDLLVATTVIEVGVDVPNASLMIIENPERLGLAQLHQLRGRVGRGSVASHCVLLYKSPLSKTASERLSVLRESNDGFVIAQRDLEIRGPGELLGHRQTGLTQMKVADLERDADLVPAAQQVAETVLKDYPQSAKAIIERWLPRRDHYAQV